MTGNASKLWSIATPGHKRMFLGLFLANLVGSFMEALSVGALIPFLALLVDPASAKGPGALRWLTGRYPHLEYSSILLSSSAAILAIFLAKAVVLLALEWFHKIAALTFVKDLSVALLGRYLKAPLTFHHRRNSTTLTGNVNQQVGLLFGLLLSMLVMVNAGLTLLALMGLLLWLDPSSFLAIGATLGLSGWLFLRYTGRNVSSLGKIRYAWEVRRDLSIVQGLGSLKETRILGRENFYLENFERAFGHGAGIQAHIDVLTTAQRHFLEVVAVATVLGAMLLAIRRGGDPREIVVHMSVFGVAAFRFLPSLVAFINSALRVSAGTNAVDILHADLIELAPGDEGNGEDDGDLPFESSVELRGVRYRYPGGERDVLAGVDLRIARNSRVGFVGATGVGKTTVVDILLGLLRPDAGELLVDGVAVGARERAWWRHLGYIPQDIYLADDTLRNNIAMGIPPEAIDDDRVWEALRTAHLDGFVASLPGGLDAVIGERGMRVSGGQRQRIGIARAFYDRPSLVVMDEATASLDNLTEREVLRSILDIEGKTTLLIIAHRMTTIRHCDRIFFMEEGRISASGTCEELMARSPGFRALAAAGDPAGASCKA